MKIRIKYSRRKQKKAEVNKRKWMWTEQKRWNRAVEYETTSKWKCDVTRKDTNKRFRNEESNQERKMLCSKLFENHRRIDSEVNYRRDGSSIGGRRKIKQ